MKLGILSIEINKYIDHFHHKIILAKRALELMDGLTGKCWFADANVTFFFFFWDEIIHNLNFKDYRDVSLY